MATNGNGFMKLIAAALVAVAISVIGGMALWGERIRAIEVLQAEIERRLTILESHAR